MSILRRVQTLIADALVTQRFERMEEELLSERLLSAELQRERTEAVEKAAVLERQLMEGQGEREDLVAALRQVRDDRATAASVTEELKQKKEKLEGELHALKYSSACTIDSLQRENGDLKARCSTLNGDVVQLQNKVQELRTKTPADAMKRIDGLEESLRHEKRLGAERLESVTVRLATMEKMRDAEVKAAQLCQKEVERLLEVEKQLRAILTVQELGPAETPLEEKLLHKHVPISHEMALQIKALIDQLRSKLAGSEQKYTSTQWALDMYAKAWWRELEGPFQNKTHEIDALVLTTQERMKERREALQQLAKVKLELKGALDAKQAAGQNRDRFCAAINVIGHELLGFTVENCAEDAVVNEARRMRDNRDQLTRFKAYVHKRLDDANVPADPEPEKTKEHGCRVEGRLNWLMTQLDPVCPFCHRHR